ncbi:MAG: hypothetical protein IT293_17620 [Deltaproteobacteria bacterium]|nr:hypothetical protein [Deltaproteobacteria bacterium]
MARSRVLSGAFAALVIAAPALIVPKALHAATYPGTKCVADKLKAASGNCKAVLGAWSKFVGGGGADTAKRDDALAKAAAKMTASWSKAETKATAKGADCIDTTLADGAMQALVANAVSDIVTDVTTGLTLGNPGDAKCGATLLKAAAGYCASLLKNEAGFVGKQSAGTAKRDAGNDKADDKFDSTVTAALAGCPTAATLASLDEDVDGLTEDVVGNSIVSPVVDDTQFTMISPGENDGVVYEGTELHPVCSHGTPYHFFVKKGSTNRLLVYYQGGGACWSTLTCATLGTFDQDVSLTGLCLGGTNAQESCTTIADCPDQSAGTLCYGDNPNNATSGLNDLTNPLNPFKDWNIVFVPYCTGDVHFGDTTWSYGGTPIRHKGWHNALIAEKWAREHFVAPEDLLVTGSSAGALGALFNAPHNLEVWPAARSAVLADAENGIIPPDFLNTPGYGLQQWNFEGHLPAIPGVAESISDGTGIRAYTEAVAAYYPNTRWAHYTTAYDGAIGGQTGFYNIMLNPGNVFEWTNWWHATCAWNSAMVAGAHAMAAAAPSNYRYYIGAGDLHTMWGSGKVYTDTSGNVPTIVDWVSAMVHRTPGWNNVECDSPTSCGTLLPGDFVPTIRQCEGGSNDGASCSTDAECPSGVCGYEAPFSVVGPDIVITCP